MGIIFHIAIVIAALVISWLQAVENEENPYGKLWNKSHHILWFRSKKNRFHVPNPFFIAGLSGVEILQQVFGPPPLSYLL